MICPRCATSNDSQATVCLQCGMALDQSEAPQSASKTSAEDNPLPISELIADPVAEGRKASFSTFAIVSLICAIAAWICIAFGTLPRYNPMLLLIAIFIAFFSAINGYTAYYADGAVIGRKTAIVALVLSHVYLVVILTAIGLIIFGMRVFGFGGYV